MFISSPSSTDHSTLSSLLQLPALSIVEEERREKNEEKPSKIGASIVGIWFPLVLAVILNSLFSSLSWAHLWILQNHNLPSSSPT